jgi:hypothetical protein
MYIPILPQVRAVVAALLFTLFLACTTTASRDGSHPEDMLITYNVKKGAESQFELLFAALSELYIKERLVVRKPICFKINDEDLSARYMAIVTWVSYFATEHPSADVEALWNRLASLCEDRAGNRGMQVRRGEILKV